MSVRTILTIAAVFIAASILNISLPLVVHQYQSIYFVLIMSSIQFIIITLIITLIIGKCHFGKFGDKRIIIAIGIFNALTAILIVYSADTSRTPAIIQSILGSTNVIPSVLFTKFILGKKVRYNPKYIVPSILLLMVSLIISCIPVIQSTFDTDTIKWICIYFIGILAGSFYNIMQEKYFITMPESSILDKLTLMTFVTISQLIILILLCWVEYFFGYTQRPIDAFVASIYTFTHNSIAIILLEIFIIFNIITHLVCLYAVQISANYTIIAITAAIPSIGVFFFIFPQFNEGIRYHWFEIFPCIICSIIAVALWLKGEHHDGYEDTLLIKILKRSKDVNINEKTRLIQDNEKIDL